MERRFWNQSLPQTLMIAAFLLYANVVTAVLFRTGNEGLFGLALYGVTKSVELSDNLGTILAIVHLVASVAAGYLVVNERKIGWKLAIGVAAAPLVAYVLIVVTGTKDIFDILSISLLFDVALFVAVIHPQSREHQRIWFS